jgi:hypothetical protein
MGNELLCQTPRIDNHHVVHEVHGVRNAFVQQFQVLSLRHEEEGRENPPWIRQLAAGNV